MITLYCFLAQTLPRMLVQRSMDAEIPSRENIKSAPSSTSLYDNVNNTNNTAGKILKTQDSLKLRDKQNETCQTMPKTNNVGISTVTVASQVYFFKKDPAQKYRILPFGRIG